MKNIMLLKFKIFIMFSITQLWSMFITLIKSLGSTRSDTYTFSLLTLTCSMIANALVAERPNLQTHLTKNCLTM